MLNAEYTISVKWMLCIPIVFTNISKCTFLLCYKYYKSWPREGSKTLKGGKFMLLGIFLFYLVPNVNKIFSTIFFVVLRDRNNK